MRKSYDIWEIIRGHQLDLSFNIINLQIHQGHRCLNLTTCFLSTDFWVRQFECIWSNGTLWIFYVGKGHVVIFEALGVRKLWPCFKLLVKSGIHDIQGYAAREFVKLGVKPGELAMFSKEAVTHPSLCEKIDPFLSLWACKERNSVFSWPTSFTNVAKNKYVFTGCTLRAACP